MAILEGIATKLKGSAGQVTFKRVAGQTIMSEKATTVTNPRTTSQQKHRMKWPNVIRMYCGIKPLLNCAFEGKEEGISDYAMFVKRNFRANDVYLTKDEVSSKACIAAPYIISQGSLHTIKLTGEAGSSLTNINLDSFTITDDTTIDAFSAEVVRQNKNVFEIGDKIAFIRVVQTTDPVTGTPICDFYSDCVTLELGCTLKLLRCVDPEGFSVSGGKLACSLGDDFQGAYAWIHTRDNVKNKKDIYISTQRLVVKNDLYTQYSTEEAYQRAVATYGGENTCFLAPGPNKEKGDAPGPEPETATITVNVADYCSSMGKVQINDGPMDNTEKTLDVEPGTEVTIKASPVAGYQFCNWSDGNSNATRTITVNEDCEFTAEFEES